MLMFNSGRWFSEPESEWLEVEANSASSLTTTQVRLSPLGDVARGGGVMAMTHQDRTKSIWLSCLQVDQRQENHDKWTSEAPCNIARYWIIAWTAGKEYGNIEAEKVRRHSDAMTLRNGSRKTEQNSNIRHPLRGGKCQVPKWKGSALNS